MVDYHISAHHTPPADGALGLGLNPGATKLLLDLEPDDPPPPMRALAERSACATCRTSPGWSTSSRSAGWSSGGRSAPPTGG